MHTTHDHPSRPHLAAVGSPTEPSDPAAQDPAPDRLPERLIVRPWFEPGLALAGVDPRSEYVERYWTAIVGPSVVLLTRRLARGLAEHPAGLSLAPADTARAIGLGGGLGRNAPMARTLERAALFGFMRRRSPETLEVRTHLPVLNARQLRRLPAAVRASHDHWLATRRQHRTPPAA